MNERDRHPDAETVAAFVDGTLDEPMTRRVAAHQEQCEECLLEIQDLVAFKRETGELQLDAPQRYSWRAIAAAVVILIALGGGVLLWRSHARSSSLISILAEASPLAERTLEPRLTGGFAWAKLSSGVRSGDAAINAQRLKLGGAAGLVLQETEHRDTAEARHAAGVAQLVIEQPKEAIVALQQATTASPGSASAWSDLAAAYYDWAVRGDHPSALPDALAAADRALQIQPEMPEALFNRALILERMGVRRQAVEAWQRYIAAEPSREGWSAEARGHLEKIDGRTSDEEFRHAFPQLEAASARGDERTVREIVDRFRQQSRRTGEVETLGQWAELLRGGDSKGAERKLNVARDVANALVSRSGERMLADAVAAVDASRSTPRERALIDAHLAYRVGRRLYAQQSLSDAAANLRDASVGFAQGVSPMALNASYYLANVTFDRTHVSEAAGELRRVQALVRGEPYRALQAEILWELGQCDRARGDWSAALIDFRDAASLFAALGERASLAQMYERMADIYERLGDTENGARHRFEAFRLLSSENLGTRLQVAIESGIESEQIRGRLDAAVAFARLLMDEAKTARNRGAMIDAYVRLAGIERELGDGPEADRELRAATQIAAAIEDPDLRRHSLAFVDFAQGAALRPTDPKRAIPLFDDAIREFRATGHTAELPDVLVERARAYRSSGRLGDAQNDLNEAIELIAKERDDVPDVLHRAGVFDAAAEAFDEAVSLDLERDAPADAFALVEKARARALLEMIGPAPAPVTAAMVQGHLDDGTALVEFVATRTSIVALTISRTDVRASIAPVSRAALAESIASLVGAIRSRAPAEEIDRKSEVIYDDLIAPSAEAIGGKSQLIIVPDAVTQRVPFAALYDRRSSAYLISDRSVLIAPSAGVFLASSDARRAHGSGLVAVGDPRSDLAPALRAADTEVQLVRASYGKGVILSGREATRAAFIAAAQSATVLHYAGHATQSALLFAGGDDGRLFAADIASLRLPAVRLVVLAACRTLTGDDEHVEWTPTLAHAFLATGASGVVGTLWDIDDTAAQAMFDRFHQSFSRGATARSALRDAQLAMLASADPFLRHPATWAGVELLGSDTRLERR